MHFKEIYRNSVIVLAVTVFLSGCSGITTIANTTPVAIAQSVSTDEGTEVNITLEGSDMDGDDLVYIVTNPTNGVLSGTAPELTYTPNVDFSGNDSFTFKVHDGKVDSDPVTVGITVASLTLNTAPVANAQNLSTDINTGKSIILTGSDADGDTLIYSAGSPANGTLSGVLPNLVYTPNVDYIGSDSFTFSVNDGTVESAAATVTITVTDTSVPTVVLNAAPVANAQNVSTDEDTPMNIILTGSDTDGDPLTYSATFPANGVLTGSAPNLVYVPNVNFNGSDSFSFTVNDGNTDSASATISISVNSRNDAPVAVNSSLFLPDLSAISAILSGSDVDGDSLIFSITSTPVNGTVVLVDATTGAYTYTPSSVANDSFMFTLTDGSGLSGNTATVTITTNTATDGTPPPVNQNLGIPDSTFNSMERENCWYCHIPSRLSDAERTNMGWKFAVPEQIKPGVVTDRHHARVGTPIQERTQAPYDAVVGQPYECLNCHQIVFNPAIGANEITQNFVDCLNCHIQMAGQASVHHLTGPAQAKDCKHCHGSRIDNPDDGHYIPTGRPATSVTPRTSGGIGENGKGACNFCHNSGTDAASGVQVGSNASNHHSTGIGQAGVSDLDCTVCHDPQVGGDLAIRRCEDCHGINSIHNIQFDSNGDGELIVGGEEAYFGHIGNQNDCIGCHGGFLGASTMAAPLSGPLVPQLDDMSTFSVMAGTTETITLSGQALTNVLFAPSGEKITLESGVLLTDAKGVEHEVAAESVTQSTLVFTVPSGLATGNVHVRAKKIEKISNALVLTVVPTVAIASVNAAGNTVTINGSGFGAYLDAVNSGTNVSVMGAACRVESWSDTQIIAECASSQCGELSVEGINGSATSSVACAE